jgi:hypothetical protein
MESRQAPHQQLTEEEIKEIVCDLTVELHEIKEHFLEQLEYVESMIYKLKRHFCPEKFQEVKVPMKTIEEMMQSSYGHMDLSQPIRMKRPENEEGNDNPA